MGIRRLPAGRYDRRHQGTCHCAGQLGHGVANRLHGKSCRAYGSGLKVQTGPGYRYPDASVSCTSFPDSETLVAEPIVIFEVLSASTAGDDRTTKLAEYQSPPRSGAMSCLNRTGSLPR